MCGTGSGMHGSFVTTSKKGDMKHVKSQNFLESQVIKNADRGDDLLATFFYHVFLWVENA